MTKVLLVAHASLATAMKHSAEMIFGQLTDFYPIEFHKEDGLESLTEKMQKQLNEFDENVLILTDLFCGTPYNAGCGIAMRHTDRRIEIVAGMSLPLVLETASMLPVESVEKIAACLVQAGMETVKSFRMQVITEEEDF